MKNNKGFTLTELLVTIVIIGVLSSVGIVSITKLRKNQEIKFNNSQLQVFKQAAQTYFTDNKEKLPLDFGEERVYLKELITNNYIDKLLDYNKKPYDENNSYVDVMRVFDKYIYTASLVIGGKDGEIIDDNSTTGSILIKMLSKPNCTGNNNTFRENCPSDYEMKNIKEYYTNTNVKMQIDLEDDNKLFAYNYTIYKNNNSIYTSEYIRTNDNTKYSDIITMNTDRYSDGIYKVEIKGINKKGQILTKTTKPIYIDLTRPTAPVITGGNAKKWKNYSQIIWTTEESTSLSGIMKYQRCEKVNENDKCNWVNLNVNGKDVTVSGLDVAYYHSQDKKLIDAFKGKTKDLIQHYIDYGQNAGRKKSDKDWLRTAQNYSEEGNYIVRFRAVNKAGTNGIASSAQRLMIDKTSPKCQVSGESEEWTKDDRNLIFKCSDNGSGCETKPQTKTIKTSMKTIEYSDKKNTAVEVKDKAGNVTKCKSSKNTNDYGNPSSVFSVYVDKTSPKCQVSGESTEWTNKNRTLKFTCSDNGSGCETKPQTKTIETSMKTIEYSDKYNNAVEVKDKAGNITKCKSSINKNTLDHPSSVFSVYVDKEPPTQKTITNSSDGKNKPVCDDVKIGAEYSDSKSGIKQISYSYDNSNWQTDWDENRTTSVLGIWSKDRKINNTIYIRACDNAGNCSSSATTTVHIGKIITSKDICGTYSGTCTEKNPSYELFRDNHMEACPNNGKSVNPLTYCKTNGGLCCEYYKSYSCQKANTCCHD